MNIHDAAYHTVHDYPGGAPTLAIRMGISPNVLQNKANPSQEYHKLTLEEALRMQAITGDHRILHAMAESLGHVCIKLADVPPGGDMELLDSFMNIVRELGEFSAEFQLDWADGRIRTDEMDRIKTKAYAVQSKLIEFVSRIEPIVEHLPASKADA